MRMQQWLQYRQDGTAEITQRIENSGLMRELRCPHLNNKTYSDTVKLMHLIEQYSCFRFLKFLLGDYVPFLLDQLHQVHF